MSFKGKQNEKKEDFRKYIAIQMREKQTLTEKLTCFLGGIPFQESRSGKVEQIK